MDNPPDTILWNDHNLYARKCDQYLYRNLEKQEELMILRIGICDDVQMNIACLTEHIRHYMASYNVQFEIESFTSGEKLLQAAIPVSDQTSHLWNSRKTFIRYHTKIPTLSYNQDHS